MKFRLLLAKALLIGLIIFSSAGGALAQEQNSQELKLSLRRNLGFGLGSLMQGNFTIRVSGPADLEQVEFLLDSQVIGSDQEEPFQLSIKTEDYESGVHRFGAVGTTSGGEVIESAPLTRQFVGGISSTWIVVAIVVVVVGFRLVQFYLNSKSKEGKKPKEGYGFMGGAVCPNCGRPFAIHFWGVNLLGNRFDRCPHCGKWNLIRRAGPQALAEAEEFARDLDGEGAFESDEMLDEGEKLQRQLDDSRYDNP